MADSSTEQRPRVERVYTDESRSERRYYPDPVWIDIVKSVCEDEGPVDQTLRQHEWLREFTQLAPLNFDLLPPQYFEAAQKAFNRAPSDCVRHLKIFAEHMRIKNLAESIMLYCIEPSQKEEVERRLDCWMLLYKGVCHCVFKKADEAEIVSPLVEDPSGSGSIQIAKTYLQERFADLDLESTALKTSLLLDNSLPKKTALYTPHAQAQKLRDWIFETTYQNWDRRRRQALLSMFATLLRIKDHGTEKTRAYADFKKNLCYFAESNVGIPPEDFPKALQALATTAAARHQQWEILYTAIKELTAEVNEQRRAIACLQYRHVLENIPNDKSTVYNNSRGPKTKGGSTVNWRTTWKIIVESELGSMVDDYNNQAVATSSRVPAGSNTGRAPAAGGPGRLTSRAAAPTKAPKDWLRELLQPEFDYAVSSWRKSLLTRPAKLSAPTPAQNPNKAASNKASKKIAQQSTHPSTQQPVQSSIQPPSQSTSSGRAPSILQVQDLGNWQVWASFTRGDTFYGLLSGNIHSFGKSYDVDDGDWLSQDRLLLKYLKPTTIDDHGTVTWEDEWQTARRLPM